MRSAVSHSINDDACVWRGGPATPQALEVNLTPPVHPAGSHVAVVQARNDNLLFY